MCWAQPCATGAVAHFGSGAQTRGQPRDRTALVGVRQRQPRHVRCRGGSTAVRPSLEMGAFIRVWRRELAGLSREQLARAITLPGGPCRTVTAATVRHWEEGQPPQTSEELEALLTTMGRHGLSVGDLAEVKRSVFAALCDRQYPAMFERGSLSDRLDVDERVERLVAKDLAAPGSISIVRLLAAMDDLRETVEVRGECLNEAHALRQLRALTMLYFAMSRRAWWMGLHSPRIASYWGRCADLADVAFGHHGLEHTACQMSVARIRTEEAFDRHHCGQGSRWAREALRRAEDAFHHDSPVVGATWFFAALHCLGEEPGVELDPFRRRIAAMLAEIERHGDHSRWIEAHVHLAWATIGAGQWETAEAAVRVMDVVSGSTLDGRVIPLVTRGALAYARGDANDGERLFAQGLEALEAAGAGTDWYAHTRARFREAHEQSGRRGRRVFPPPLAEPSGGARTKA